MGALGYHVILASNGIEAVQLFKDNSDRIDLVVMDVVMPGMSGPDAYLKMSAIRPDLGVVFTSGYTAEATSLTSLVEKGASVLQKPGKQTLERFRLGEMRSKQEVSTDMLKRKLYTAPRVTRHEYGADSSPFTLGNRQLV